MQFKHTFALILVIPFLAVLGFMVSLLSVKPATANALSNKISESPVETQIHISFENSDRVTECSDSDGKHPCPH